ncbi:MAG TPA: universal stress protein [Bdellovibrionota bacterium]|nr:universal stress protein [Bdellovibrionota bacterium]
MRKISKILLPVDFSDGSNRASEYAVTLCRALGAQLELYHVVEAGHFVMYGNEAFWPSQATVQEIESSARKQMETFAKKLDPEISMASRIETTPAPAADQICQYAKKQNADLIVMSTHGRSGLDRVLLGSVTDRVVRTAPCPVFVVRHAAT